MPKTITLVDYARSQCIRFLGTDDAAAMATALNDGGLALSAFEPFVILVHDTGCLDQALAAANDNIAARIRDALDALGRTGSESFSDVADDAWKAWYADHPYPDQLVRIAKFRSCWKRMHDPETIAERKRLLAKYGLDDGRNDRRLEEAMAPDRSYYNSTNSHVLATREDSGGNVRMLLYKPHPPIEGGEPVGREFVIGSYFHATPFPDGVTDYAWSWGNYFADVSDAVEFWNESAPRAREEV